jgi:hypothetical protein
MEGDDETAGISTGKELMEWTSGTASDAVVPDVLSFIKEDLGVVQKLFAEAQQAAVNFSEAIVKLFSKLCDVVDRVQTTSDGIMALFSFLPQPLRPSSLRNWRVLYTKLQVVRFMDNEFGSFVTARILAIANMQDLFQAGGKNQYAQRDIFARFAAMLRVAEVKAFLASQPNSDELQKAATNVWMYLNEAMTMRDKQQRNLINYNRNRREISSLVDAGAVPGTRPPVLALEEDEEFREARDTLVGKLCFVKHEGHQHEKVKGWVMSICEKTGWATVFNLALLGDIVPDTIRFVYWTELSVVPSEGT